MENVLIKRVQQFDDHQAFEKLIKQHQSPLRQFLRRLTQQDHAIADELAQETFFKAYRHIHSYRGEGKFLSWLFKIAYQHFIGEQRKKREYSNVELQDQPDEINQESQIIAERTVQQLMKYLRADERAALLLHFRHELSHPEVAEVMILPLGTVKSLIRRAKQKLKTMLETGNIKEQVTIDE
jgi:RNA polymerase sigma-70 factor (ECF subfamily)